MKSLIVVDIQNDFLPEGALAVDKGDEIIPVVNDLMKQFKMVVATQDWHPANHGSFASNYRGKKPGETIVLNGLDQILWPDHCIQETYGAEFGALLNCERFTRIFQKGTDPGVDSYSGFFDNGKKIDTGLGNFLKSSGINEVYVVGLATDYCVKYTALDAAALGFKTTVIADATRAVNLQEGDYNRALKEMERNGVIITRSGDYI